MRAGLVGVAVVWLALFRVGLPAGAQDASLPELIKASVPQVSGAGKAAGAAAGKGAPQAGTSRDLPKEKVAAPEGPIKVERGVQDRDIRRTLEHLLPRYPGVHSVQVRVDHGIVTLDGRVDDDDTSDDLTKFTERVEGVRLVLNRMKTDAEALSARDLAMKELNTYRDLVARKWVVALVALAVVLGFLLLARLFDRYSETLLAPFLRNVILRTVVGSFLGTLLIMAGLLLALSILNLTRAVLSLVGLAGVVGLALGFAFRDIAENFIASVLLGVRRPFQIGDYIRVAGQEGVVRSLNTRATVLVTLEGHHVRIPNSTIFKEILVNLTASPSTRVGFDVVIPYTASTAAAITAVNEALAAQRGILAEPPPRALVHSLEPDGVHLRVTYWMPSKGIDHFQLMSDARLQAKVALQQAGILTAQPAPAVVAPAASAAAPAPSNSASPSPSPAPASEAKAQANLQQDSQAAAAAAAQPATPKDGRATPMQHVLEQAGACVSDEGANLLGSGSGSGSGTGNGKHAPGPDSHAAGPA